MHTDNLAEALLWAAIAAALMTMAWVVCQPI